jgi:hypothetical protein
MQVRKEKLEGRCQKPCVRVRRLDEAPMIGEVCEGVVKGEGTRGGAIRYGNGEV